MIFLQSIGQAYDEMQTQNQHLLQQVTERDDYNIKVICCEIGWTYIVYFGSFDNLMVFVI